MFGLVPGILVFLIGKGEDGRAEPGNDGPTGRAMKTLDERPYALQ